MPRSQLMPFFFRSDLFHPSRRDVVCFPNRRDLLTSLIFVDLFRFHVRNGSANEKKGQGS